MREFRVLGLLTAIIAGVIYASSAQAVTIQIPATQAGCGPFPNCSNAADNLTANELVTLGANPVLQTFGPGTYTLTNGDLTGAFSAFRFNGGSNWAWNFGIATYNGNGTGNLFFVGGSEGVSSTQAGMAQSQGANRGGPSGPTSALPLLGTFGPDDYSVTFTLLSTKTLAFFVLDYPEGLSDNAGGIALNIQAVGIETPLPAALPLFASILAGGGLIAWRRKRKAAKVAA